jgi:hypothetical protein
MRPHSRRVGVRGQWDNIGRVWVRTHELRRLAGSAQIPSLGVNATYDTATHPHEDSARASSSSGERTPVDWRISAARASFVIGSGAVRACYRAPGTYNTYRRRSVPRVDGCPVRWKGSQCPPRHAPPLAGLKGGSTLSVCMHPPCTNAGSSRCALRAK